MEPGAIANAVISCGYVLDGILCQPLDNSQRVCGCFQHYGRHILCHLSALDTAIHLGEENPPRVIEMESDETCFLE